MLSDRGRFETEGTLQESRRIEDEMEEHEDECGDRKVECDFGRDYIPFNYLLDHLKDEHKVDYEVKN